MSNVIGNLIAAEVLLNGGKKSVMFLIFTIISVVACIPFIFLGKPVKVVAGQNKIEDRKDIASTKQGIANTIANSDATGATG